MTWGLIFASTVICAVAAGRTLAAQVVRLTVRDSLTKEVLNDAIVTMVDRGGTIAASGRTRSGGLLLLKAKAASYSLFVRKLGFAPAVSDWFEVA
ncbi:MAG: hypothetical protein ABI877_20805, partial [Gemmatimonadaceae bacterium]